MNDYPLSCFTDALKTTTGGVLSFYAGLVGGSIIVFSERLDYFSTWGWCLVAWIAIIPYTIAKLWGLVLAPLLGVMLLGTIWLEWNRLIVASSVAILLSATTLYCAKYNPFAEADSAIPFTVTVGIALVLFSLGVILEIIKMRSTMGSRVRATSGASPDP